MPAFPRTTIPTALLLAAIVAAGTAHAANPLGRYEGAKLKTKFKLNPVGSERVTLRDGTVKVKRRVIKASFPDAANDRRIKLVMRLESDVLDVTNQIVVVEEGEVFLKDLVTGATIASGGEFVRGRFRIRRRNDEDRTWIIKHDQRLKVRDVSGVLTGLAKGKIKAKR